MEGDSSLYRAESGWKGWPEDAKEIDVVKWFAHLIDQLLDFTEEHLPAPRSRRRLLAQTHRSLQGSTADHKLDIGFVGDPDADTDSKCHCAQTLIPEELTKVNKGEVADEKFSWDHKGDFYTTLPAINSSHKQITEEGVPLWYNAPFASPTPNLPLGQHLNP